MVHIVYIQCILETLSTLCHYVPQAVLRQLHNIIKLCCRVAGWLISWAVQDILVALHRLMAGSTIRLCPCHSSLLSVSSCNFWDIGDWTKSNKHKVSVYLIHSLFAVSTCYPLPGVVGGTSWTCILCLSSLFFRALVASWAWCSLGQVSSPSAPVQHHGVRPPWQPRRRFDTLPQHNLWQERLWVCIHKKKYAVSWARVWGSHNCVHFSISKVWSEPPPSDI